MSSIFGGSKQSSSSSNKAFDSINSSFSPLFGLAGTGAQGIQSLLGGDMSGFNLFKDATGFDFAAEQGSRGITGNAAARGLLRSGSTGKSLVDYGNNIQNQYAQSYMDRLMGLSGLGMQAGGLVTQAGQTSESQGKSKEGIGKALGAAASMAAMSDRRLKKDIKEVGKLANGLNLYEFKYVDDSGPFIGVMADEVADIQPEALGPVIDGYQSVDYGKINWEVV